jgi:hypothetical protein
VWYSGIVKIVIFIVFHLCRCCEQVKKKENTTLPHYHKAYNDGRVVRGCKTKQNNETVTMAFGFEDSDYKKKKRQVAERMKDVTENH